MNIREIERQLGIPRANIRYYEEEGLLHPARGSNNYRTYSEKDVETLRKIRLLRRLDMPIETIRAVQAGEWLHSHNMKTNLEGLLDCVEEGTVNWKTVIENFIPIWKPRSRLLRKSWKR